MIELRAGAGVGFLVGVGLGCCCRWNCYTLSLGFGVRFVVRFDVRVRAGVRVGVGVEVKVKVKVRVYSLVSSAKHHSPDFIQLLPGHRTC